MIGSLWESVASERDALGMDDRTYAGAEHTEALMERHGLREERGAVFNGYLRLTPTERTIVIPSTAARVDAEDIRLEEIGHFLWLFATFPPQAGSPFPSYAREDDRAEFLATSWRLIWKLYPGRLLQDDELLQETHCSRDEICAFRLLQQRG